MQQVLERQETKGIKLEEEPLISFIVPVHAKNLDPAVLKRCLMSLDDQDYENKEVIVVINGGKDPELQKTAEFFANQDSQFQVYQIDEPGACNARNYGFEKSTGEVVSFFNSDYRLKPGMARLWVESLLKNPECGFAYGGYEYATTPAEPYWSRKFDEFALKNFNYIDCGFPLWRKYVVKWDPEVKSLQDWDFWLRVVKTHKVKGYYINRDLTFIAEPPRKNGLSEDSASNWIDRVKFIKKKNKIPMSDMLVASIGAPFHAAEIAKMLGADFRDGSVIYKPNEYRAIYMIGFYLKPHERNNEHPKIMASFKPEVKKIIHFVGADIYWLRKFPFDSLKIMAGIIRMGSDHILCENEKAQSELKEMGIDAKIVPIPTYNDFEVKPMPEKYRVAVYLTNQSDFDKYFQKHTLSIIRAMPDVEFSGYGDGATDFKAPNFKHYGNIPVPKFKDFVYEHSTLLRLVRHDTLPMAACDFFQAGRMVISNIPMKYGIHVDTQGKDPLNEWDIFSPGFSDKHWPDTKKEIVSHIRDLRDHSEVFNIHRQESSRHWKSVLNKRKYRETIYRLAKGGKHA